MFSQLLISSQVDFAHLRKLKVIVVKPTTAKLCAVEICKVHTEGIALSTYMLKIDTWPRYYYSGIKIDHSTGKKALHENERLNILKNM